MRTTTREWRPAPGRRLLCIGIAGAMPLLAAQAPIAQTDAERLEALRACLDIESDAARLLCFESIVAAQPAGTDASAERSGATSTNEEIEVAADAEPPDAPDAPAAASAPAAPSAPPAPPAPSAPDPIDVADGSGAGADESVPPTAAQTADDRAPAADVAPVREREQDRTSDEERAETVVIVEAGRLYRGNATFAADDGRLFVQTSGSTSRPLPDAPFEATLEAGAFSSVFLVVPSAGLRVRVREQTE